MVFVLRRQVELPTLHSHKIHQSRSGARTSELRTKSRINFAKRFLRKFSRRTQVISASFQVAHSDNRAKPSSGAAAVTTLTVWPKARRRIRKSSRLLSQTGTVCT